MSYANSVDDAVDFAIVHGMINRAVEKQIAAVPFTLLPSVALAYGCRYHTSFSSAASLFLHSSHPSESGE